MGNIRLGQVLAGLGASLAIFAIHPSACGAADTFQYDILKRMDPTTGVNPVGNLVLANGRLYGVNESFDSISTTNETLFSLATDGSDFQVLHEFAVQAGDGRRPVRDPLLASDGRLYGVTYLGGANNRGSIYGINPDGTGYQLLYSFVGTPGLDGQNPENGLCEGDDGYLYGANYIGGANLSGTVFRISKSGDGYAIVRNFSSNLGGLASVVSVIRGSDGWLYGVCGFGGDLSGGGIFKLQTTGAGYTVIHQFQNNSLDGYRPVGRLLEASDGMLYGVTSSGGMTELSSGTIFRLSKDGTQFQVLKKYGPDEGSRPHPRLTDGWDGKIYGALSYGGSRAHIFRLARDGSDYEPLHYFDDGVPMGSFPFGGVTLGRSGELYGCTALGGVEPEPGKSYGLIYRLALQPAVTVTATSPSTLSLQLHGAPLESYRVEDSSALPAVQWGLVETVTTDAQGDASPVTTAAPISGNRFFRAIRSE
jgi:uncharacterized repeat protein (TIGR03803 family)